MDTDSKSILNGYSDVSDDESDGVNVRMSCALYYRCWMMRSLIFARRKGVCESVNIQSLIGISPVAMDVLANIQLNTSVIYV